MANVIFDRTLSLRDVSLRQELGWTRGAHLVEAGGELHRLSTGLSFDITGDRNPNAANGSSQQGGAGLPDSLRSLRDVTRGGLWVLDRWQAAPAMALEGGVRIDRSGVNLDTQVSPRVTATWGLDSRTRLRTALGRYTQSPGYEKLVQSDYVLDLTGDQVGRLRSEQAVQLSAGLERDIAGAATLRIEGYYKTSSRLLVGRLETEAERQARVAGYDFPDALASSVPTDPIITSTPTNDGSGRAYGFDVFVSRMTAPVAARVRGWASYTWGRATREAYGRTYPFEYDRRHAFSAVVSYRLTDRWELASTTRLASGFPRTPPLDLRVASEFDAADLDQDGNVEERVPAVDSRGRLIYAVDFGGIDNLNAGRLPLFARVDLRATWRPRGAQGRWELYAEVINLLNRQNAGALEAELVYDPESDRPKNRRAARSGDPASADRRAPLQLLTGFTPSAGTRASTNRRSGGSAETRGASASSAVSARFSARRLLCSWSTVTAPESTTSAHGWRSAVAIATSSCAARRPLASASFTITPRPAAWASASAAPLDGSRTFQVDCTTWKRAAPSTRHGHRAANRLGLPRSGRRESDGQAVLTQACKRAEDSCIGEHAAFDRRRVDLVEPQMRAEERTALGGLACERFGGQLLSLLDRSVHPPVAGIGVPPLGTDDGDVKGRPAGRQRNAPVPQPRSQEGFGVAVRSRRVEIAHACRICGIEHLVGAALHRSDRAIVAEVARPAIGDVCRPAERRQAEADPGDLQTCRAERTKHP